MYGEVWRGGTTEPEALQEAMHRFDLDLRLQAQGFLAANGGVSNTGEIVWLFQYDSFEDAQALAALREYKDWYAQAARSYDTWGPIVHQCPNVEVLVGAAVNDAKFLQVIDGRPTNRDEFLEREPIIAKALSAARPEIVAILVAWRGNYRSFTQFTYFSSEHAGVAHITQLPDAACAAMNEWSSLTRDREDINIPYPTSF